MPINIQDPSINNVNFDQLLQNRGIRFIHKKSCPCPNIKGVEENSHTPGCKFCDESGIMFYSEKEVWGVFTSNTLEKLFEIQGVWEIGTAVVTMPAEYTDGTQADFNVYDHLICPDFQIRLNDLKEYHPDDGRRMWLKYPIIKVEYMASVRNGILFTYTEGVDFIIVDGEIEFMIGKTPSYNPINDLGEVMTITYLTNPVYGVQSVMHELRVTQVYDPNTGTKTAVRLPQQILVKRDFLSDEQNRGEQNG
jgi:hypothetical protein